MTVDLPTPPDRPITWQAARGRFVVLVRAQSWFDARDIARAMLGGEPGYVSSVNPGFDGSPLFIASRNSYRRLYPERRADYSRRYMQTY